jgi:ribosomal protein L11 methylase PrmA
MTRRSISVKIPTTKLISALETKLAEYNSMRDNYDSLKAKHEKAMEAWKKEVAQLVTPANLGSIVVNDRHWRTNEHEIHMIYNIKSSSVPKQPEAPKAFSYIEREAVENIENALRILRMTEQEEVSTSTYNAVAQYL